MLATCRCCWIRDRMSAWPNIWSESDTHKMEVRLVVGSMDGGRVVKKSLQSKRGSTSGAGYNRSERRRPYLGILPL